MRRRGQSGQTTSEYLMIAGLITAMTLLVLGWTYSPFRAALLAAAECVLGDVCGATLGTGAWSGGPGGAGSGGPVGPPVVTCERAKLQHAAELAAMAADSYAKPEEIQSIEPVGRRVAGVGMAPEGLMDADFESNTGFRAALYEAPSGSGHYVLAFAGTDDLKDAGADVWQALGRQTEQYDQAVNLTASVQAWVKQKGGTLELTGHSLGGGLATTAAMSSGLPATTFNTARPSAETVADYGTTGSWEEAIDNYQVDGEFLGPLQERAGITAAGRQHLLPGSGLGDPFSRHRMAAVKAALMERIAGVPAC